MSIVRTLAQAIANLAERGQLGPSRAAERREFLPGRPWSGVARARSRRQ